jgi:hypothetical protein
MQTVLCAFCFPSPRSTDCCRCRTPTATCRYTECRLRHAASAMLLADLEMSTVDFIPNFDASVVSARVR